MKIKVIGLLFFLAITFQIHAQDFNGGVLAGLSMAEISGDRLEGPNKAGVYFGGYVNRYFSDRSSIQMELDFIQKGSRQNPDSTNNYQSYLLRLNYIEIPVHYKYDFADRGTLEVGLSYGVLIYSYEEANGSTAVSGSDFQSGDLSFNFGAYYTLWERMRVNIRYSNSIMAVRPHNSGQTYRWNNGQYNEVLSITFHYDL